MNRLRKSIEAHTQNWQSKHFEKTKMGKRIQSFKDIHKGEKCFIIGNGPSLKPEDLQKLHENEIITFGTNRVFNIFDQTDWRPTYYASEDIIIIKDIQNEIEEIEATAKFVPVNLKWYEDINVHDADYFFMEYKPILIDSFNLSTDVAKKIICRGTVTVTCIQLAIYMGFSDIYLLGVDHNYAKIINEKGEVVEDINVKDYFSEKYENGIKNQLVHDIGTTTKSFYDVECLSKKLGTFRVFNATRGGKLEIFERADFDELFRNNTI